jgi:RNA polymerase sigma-70 factor, ECF subfamily
VTERAKLSDSFVRQLSDCQSRLYGYILTLLPDFTAANDVLGETNVAICRKADEFVAGTLFASWALRIAYFEVLAYRKRQHSDRHLFDDALVGTIAVDAASPAEDDCPKRRALRGCLEKLLPRDARLINLRYHSCKVVAEIAAEQGKSAGAVSQALYRIRNVLADCVQRTLELENRG